MRVEGTEIVLDEADVVKMVGPLLGGINEAIRQIQDFNPLVGATLYGVPVVLRSGKRGDQ